MNASVSGLRFWLTLLLFLWLISSVGLWWLIKSFFILLAVLLLLPIVGVIGFRFWLQRSLIPGNCPVCNQNLVAIRNRNLQCPNCGEPLSATDTTIRRNAPPGIVDVEVVDVSATEED
ncbi:MAG: hypothetical protein VKJ64_07340 [Leptolyngbyaceae bacterium]|nr:hypothetical protein [Leptolyngbyaceae bacterium]